MSEDDIDALGADGQGGAVASSDRDRRAPRFSWTPAYENTFFRSLCDSVQLGLRENSSFKAEAWERARVALQATHGAYPAKSHLINKSDNARKRFRLWRGLREDPEFLYNPATRTVTATEDAWRAHIEREPLSRALRGRPFDHEDFMEILYPDVIGSGGAPKRIIKPRRKTDGTAVDDAEMPGTGVINLTSNPQTTASSPGLAPRPNLGQSASRGSPTAPAAAQQLQPASAASSAAASQINSMMSSSSSALTPPDDTAPQSQGQSRKRRQGGPVPGADSGLSPPLPPATAPASVTSSPHKRRRTSSRGLAPVAAVNPMPPAALVPAAHQGQATHDASSLLQAPLLEEILDTLRARAPPRWREQALDIFFRDFSSEEMDLQVKISENVLSNENKAMVFCKMPEQVRQHWVGKFREMHQQNKTA